MRGEAGREGTPRRRPRKCQGLENVLEPGEGLLGGVKVYLSCPKGRKLGAPRGPAREGLELRG